MYKKKPKSDTLNLSVKSNQRPFEVEGFSYISAKTLGARGSIAQIFPGPSSDGPGEWSHFQVCLLVIRIIQVITYSSVRKMGRGEGWLSPCPPPCSDGPGEWSHFQVCLLVIRIIQVITYSSVRKSSEGKISVVRMLNESHKSPNQRQLLRSHALNVQTCRTGSTLDNVLVFWKSKFS